jgi:hypothetical protein
VIIQTFNITVALHIDASDQVRGSGVVAMQIAADSNLTGASWQPFNAMAQINHFHNCQAMYRQSL